VCVAPLMLQVAVLAAHIFTALLPLLYGVRNHTRWATTWRPSTFYPHHDRQACAVCVPLMLHVSCLLVTMLLLPLLFFRQASYALGYNLAIEYLADYEKTWMLDSFRDLNARVLNKGIDWIFLEVRQRFRLQLCMFY
jgi:hypothetical protein